jgi:hypothetical protein
MRMSKCHPYISDSLETNDSRQSDCLGAEQFGGTFSIPGLVTVGPNFQIFGEISGTATLHA